MPLINQIQITPALPSHSHAVLAFELENRLHFEQWIASRGDHFYSTQAVQSSLEQAQWSAHAQREYHYLAWLGDEIIGRITLRGIEREHYFKASLGYRFSVKHGGKGYATTAVNAVLAYAFNELKLWRVEAMIISDNLPSIAVIKKCGFTQFGHSRSAVLRSGVWRDLLLFEKHADSATNDIKPS
ncbi:GNAT family N-acetyltransferase [Undibacterium sp. RuRC25W]|uniref:GNAT family N-acetyltransferase n=1 Tax=Undibacterium sp. RuRC25W TaxID=3413047 RepID=UPI003BF32995